MDARQAFGNYLKQADLGHGQWIRTIGSINLEPIPDDKDPGKHGLVVRFLGEAKPWIMNKTNMEVAAVLFGSIQDPNYETEQWVGRSLELFVDPTVMFGGKQTGGIKVASQPPPPTAAAVAMAAPGPAQPAPAQPAPYVPPGQPTQPAPPAGHPVTEDAPFSPPPGYDPGRR